MKKCMGIATKKPNTAKCQKCLHLVTQVSEERTTKEWIEPSMPCKEYEPVGKAK